MKTFEALEVVKQYYESITFHNIVFGGEKLIATDGKQCLIIQDPSQVESDNWVFSCKKVNGGTHIELVK